MENQIKSQVEQIENLISVNGCCLEYAELLYQLADLAINQYKLIKLGLYASNKAKETIQHLVGNDVWDIYDYCKNEHI